jgi:hypothetical protein
MQFKLFLHFLCSKLAVKLIKSINAVAFVQEYYLKLLVTSCDIFEYSLKLLVTSCDIFDLGIYSYDIFWSWNYSCDIRNTVCFHTCFFAAQKWKKDKLEKTQSYATATTKAASASDSKNNDSDEDYTDAVERF